MQRNAKRIISFILALVMIFGIINTNPSMISVFAGDLGDSPLLQDDFYQIETREDLEWFAQEVNSGRKNINGKLTENIELDSSVEWTPIGTSLNQYIGVFDGNSKSISNLNINTGTYRGLFGYIDVAGTVKELTITDSSVSGTQYIGLVAGRNSGTISGVTVDNSSVKGKQNVGGIVGENKGTIIASANKGAIITQDTYDDKGIAGIAGINSGNISLSYNNANVTRSHTRNDYGYFGGIVGENTSTGIIDSCYNTGEIAGGYRSGGIAAINTKTISNSYNTGTVNSGSSSSAVGAIFAYGFGGTADNSYYLNTSVTKPNTHGISKTDDEMKAVAPLLGDAFENDLECPINSGYPILKWQNPEAEYTITLTVSPENAVVVLTSTTGQAISADFSEDGVYIFNNVVAGTYQYNASYEAGDYEDATGNIIVSRQNVSQNVTLSKRNYEVEFTVNPQDALVSVNSGEINDSKIANSGVAMFMLPNGTYDYTVDKFGYSPQSGTITVNRGNISESVNLVQSEQFILTFDITPAEADVTVSHPLGGVQNAETDGTYRLYNGTYNYTVKLLGYSTVKGTVTIDGFNKSETVNLTKNLPWTGNVAAEFYGGTGTKDDPYLISNGEELAYLSSLISNPETNRVYKNLYYKLVDNIDMGSVDFIPIGTKISEGYYFAGSFDGDEYVISNLKVKRTESYAGLFGMAKDGASLSNIVLRNPLIESTGSLSTHVGGLVGYISGSSVRSTISNCAVIDGKINSESFNLGGLAGYASGANITESYAVVEINGTGTNNSYAGLLVGQSGGGNIEHSFARGKVTTSGKFTGGLVGSLALYSTLNIKYSYVSGDIIASNINYGYVVGSVESGAKFNVTGCYYNPDVVFTGKDGSTSTNGFIAEQLKSDESLELLNAGGEKYARLGLEERYINDGYPYLIDTYYVTVEPEQLSAPTGLIWIENTKATWNSSENAIGYRVSLYKNDEKVFECNRDESTLEYNFADEISVNGSGAYTFSVKALGDNYFYYASLESEKSSTYNATVTSQNVMFNISLPENERYYRENDPIITVVVGNTTVEFNAGEAQELPQGSNYTYTIDALGFKVITGELSVNDEDVIIEKTLEADAGWDGVSTLEPIQIDGVYQISSGYNLAWFRDEINKTIKAEQSSDLSAKLVRDIDLCGFEWQPIGTYTSSSATFGYTGTFDGNGHTIDGLSITTGKDGSALFGYIYANSAIENLTVKGNVSAGQYSAGIVAISSAATIRNCINYVDVTVTKVESRENNIMVGGIVGSMTNYTNTVALTEYCINYGDIIGKTTNSYIAGVVGYAGYGVGVRYCGNEGAVSGNDSVGGVVGRSSVIITSCYNTGNISGAKTSIGGIAGFSNKLTKDSYNTGNISGKGKVGGIVGELHSEYGGIIEGSYNTGTITKSGTGDNDTHGAIAGFKGGPSKTISKSFFLEAGIAGIGKNANDEDSAVSLTENELKEFSTVALLGGTFSREENAYPLLRWQESANKDVVVLFNTEPSDAEIILKDDSKQTVEPAEGTKGYLLESGNYKYKIKKSNWQEVNRDLVVLNDNIVIDIVMNPSDSPVFDPIDVVLSVQKDSTGFLIARQVNEVSPSLAKSYGYTNDPELIEEDEVSALDVLVAAHIAIYGDDREDINNALVVNNYGYVTKVFGVSTSNFSFYVNGEQPHDGIAVEYPGFGTQYTGYAVTQARINENDLVEFFFVQDTQGWTDKYAWFDLNGAKIETITATAGESFDIAVKGYMAIYGLNIPVERDGYTNPIEGAAIVPVELDGIAASFGDAIAVTNADGIAHVTLNEAGTYILSAVNSTGTSPLMSPWIVVTVEEAPPVYEGITVGIRAQKDDTGFVLVQNEREIIPGLAKSYGYTNDPSLIGDDEVSTLDALVAVHISMYGEDRTAINNALVVGNGGWVTKMFGISTSSIGIFVNGEQPNDGISVQYPGFGTQYGGYSVSQAKLNNGDKVEFFILHDDYAMDIYAWFTVNGTKVENLNMTTGENLDVVLRGYMSWYGLNIPSEREAYTNPIEGALIVPVTFNNDDEGAFGEHIAITNNNGVASLNFSEAGTYIVSAVGDDEEPIMSPLLVITVTDSSEPDEEVLVVIELIDAIPENVTLDDEQAVLAAKTAFDALTEEQKGQISQLKRAKLLEAIQRIADLKAADEVRTLINALPEDIQLSDKEAVQNARFAYDALTNTQKSLIDVAVLNKLLAAEEKIADLERPVATTPSAVEVMGILQTTAAYQFSRYEAPTYGSIGGEWVILGLARGGFITDEYKEIYLANLREIVENAKGVLAAPGGTYSEYSRVILALSSLGEEPSNFAGYNLLAPLAEFDNVIDQGNNGTAYALIALNSNDYDIPLLPLGSAYIQTTRELLISTLLDEQLEDGGWSISSRVPSSTPDYTSMVVQALAPYYGQRNDVTEALDRAILRLSELQLSTAGYGSAESTAQVIIALNDLGISLTDERFVKNGKTIYDDLMTLYMSDIGAFKHSIGNNEAGQMATDQSMYSLVSLYRLLTGKNRLYDMTDVDNPITPPEINKGLLILAINNAEKLIESEYTVESWEVFKTALNEAKAVYEDEEATQDEVDLAYSALILAIDSLVKRGGSEGPEDPEDPKTSVVTFRLIGAKKHPNQKGYGDETEYQNWIKTTTYSFKSEEVTVYEVFDFVLSKAGLDYVEKVTNYISKIQAPVGYGGEYLGEFDNGKNSGWMFTINGVHKDGLRTEYVKDGDSIIWHYVDDFILETDFEGGIAKYPNGWLKVADVDPPTSPVIPGPDPTPGPTPGPSDNASDTENAEFKNTFNDISENDWYYNAVKYVVENGIMQGISDNTFSANANVTRAMLVTMLYRYDGKPDIEEIISFTDIEGGQWYTDAVAWAYANGIVKGYTDDSFKPDNSLTREEIVTILYRYAEKKGLDISQKADLQGYTDVGSISDWSYTAMEWAKATGIMNGRTNTELAPKGVATRAEIATLIMRFIEEFVKGNE